MTLTFEELGNKMANTFQNIAYVSTAALDKGDLNAPWLERPILARWLFGSALEFQKEYRTEAGKYLKEHNLAKDQLAEWDEHISHQVNNFRFVLRNNYSSDEAIMEATA